MLEKSYKEYLEGFTDIATGKARRGYLEVVKELQQRFPNPDEIVKESDKKTLLSYSVSICASRISYKTMMNLQG